MSEVSTSASRRFSYHRTSNGLGIEIPAKRNYFILVFMAVWLTGWTVGGIFAGSELFFGGAPIHENLFLLFWMVGWAFGWIMVVYTIMWQLFGYEMIFVTAGSLVVEKRMLLPFRRKIFAIDQIRNMKTDETPHSKKQNSAIGRPSISFKYDDKTVRFALDLNKADTHQLLEILKKDMPSVFKSHYSE